MAKKRHGEAHGGGHGWFVTFADLMGLLVAFFVMLVAFSNQDAQKLKIVAGSMRDAFGVQDALRLSGMIEMDGLPIAAKPRHISLAAPQAPADKHGPDAAQDADFADRAQQQRDAHFAQASVSLRQALQDMPEITAISKQIMFVETPAGLNLEIMDQEGRAMFASGSHEPNPRLASALRRIALPLRATSLRIIVTGHSSSGYIGQHWNDDAIELTSRRANAVRRVLQQAGLPSAQILAVTGKADTQPLFSEDAAAFANRRITIALMREEPSLPPNLRP